VRNKVTFWTRFNLSLPGRIDIAKTMIYSQLNYIGCFLPLSDELIANVQNQIIDYVKGPLRIAEKRVFMRTEVGGLGLFDVVKGSNLDC
jgi:hypothetical protein